MKYLVKGTTKDGKEKSKLFHCYEDALNYSISGKWSEVEITKVNPTESNQVDEKTASRGEHATWEYLVRMGYRIRERGFDGPFGRYDFIAVDDDGSLVFIDTEIRMFSENARMGEFDKEEEVERFEGTAAYYLAFNDDIDVGVRVRYDRIDLTVVGKDRAFLRHHVGALG